MAATVSGSKTCTKDAHPGLTAAALTTLLATAPENLTVANLRSLTEALSRVPGGGSENTKLGALLP